MPAGWVAGDETGHAGVCGNQNDVGVVRPTGGRAPWVLAILTERADVDAPSDEALLTRATAIVVDELT